MQKSQQASQISNFTTYVLCVIFKQESIRLEIPQKAGKWTGFCHFSWQKRVSADYLRRLWVQLGGLMSPKLRKQLCTGNVSDPCSQKDYFVSALDFKVNY